MLIQRKGRQHRAAGQFVFAAKPASDSDEESEIAHLKVLDLDGLKLRWWTVFGRKAPNHLPKHLVLRLLTYQLQTQVHGDLSRSTFQFLDGLARNRETLNGSRVGGAVALPAEGPLKPGTVLIREYDGERHRVTVVANGFVWNGTTYPSLTKVARIITGTGWNGPRFFGLRDKRMPS